MLISCRVLAESYPYSMADHIPCQNSSEKLENPEWPLMVRMMLCNTFQARLFSGHVVTHVQTPTRSLHGRHIYIYMLLYIYVHVLCIYCTNLYYIYIYIYILKTTCLCICVYVIHWSNQIYTHIWLYSHIIIEIRAYIMILHLTISYSANIS